MEAIPTYEDYTIRNYLCKVQGSLFKLAEREGLDCDEFVKFYMNSETAVCYDKSFDPIQNKGEGYILEELEDDSGGLPRSDKTYGPEIMYWIGYLYAYWHLYTGESSREIYKRVDARTLAMLYPGYHTLDIEAAIDRLLED